MLAFRDTALETRVKCIAAEKCKKLRLVDLVESQYIHFLPLNVGPHKFCIFLIVIAKRLEPGGASHWISRARFYMVDVVVMKQSQVRWAAPVDR